MKYLHLAVVIMAQMKLINIFLGILFLNYLDVVILILFMQNIKKRRNNLVIPIYFAIFAN